MKQYLNLETYLGDKFHLGAFLVFACVSCLFLPVYFLVPPGILLFFWIVFNKECRQNILQINGVSFLGLFSLIMVVVSAVYKNYLGLLTAIGFIMLMVIGLGFRVILKGWQFEKALGIVGAGSVFGFLVALTQIVSNLGDAKYRASSVTVNPNYYGTLAAVAALVCLYKIACNSSFKFVYAIILMLNIVGMEMAKCRSAIGAVFLSIMVFFLFNKQKKLLAAAVGISGVFASILLFRPEVLGRFSSITKDFAVRNTLWEAGIKGFQSAPIFGKGPFSFIFNNIPTKIGFQPHSHNIIIEFLVNFGLIGVVIFSFYAAKLLIDAYTKAKKSGDIKHFALTMSMCSFIMAQGMLDCTIIWPNITLLILFVVSSVGKGVNGEKSKSPAA